MKHKGVEYTIERTTTPGVWKWKFRIGDKVVTGKTETAINFLAIRRVQQRIDREQKKLHVTNNCTRKSMPAFSLSTIRTNRLHHAVSGVRPPLRTSSTEPTFARCDWIIPALTRYTFRIRQGSHSSDLPVDLPDDAAAWDEAAMACSDMIRDTVARLGDSPEWRLEVVDKSGTVRHLFRVIAETFDP